jgi:hypothetical protein
MAMVIRRWTFTVRATTIYLLNLAIGGRKHQSLAVEEPRLAWILQVVRTELRLSKVLARLRLGHSTEKVEDTSELPASGTFGVLQRTATSSPLSTFTDSTGKLHHTFSLSESFFAVSLLARM